MREGTKRQNHRKRESRMRCQVCGGPLRVEYDYAKSANIMVRKRQCLHCQSRYESVEIVKLLDVSPQNRSKTQKNFD